MKLKERQRDSRFLKTMGFLVAKNLLKTNREDIQPRARVKLAIKDVLWAGNNVEPRILEVLPAALIHFPKTFKGLDQLPKELSSIVEQIRRQQTDGPDYKGLKYRDMYRWANFDLPDKRTRPVKDKRVTKSFRLHPDAYKKLKEKAEEADQTMTSYLEGLILA